VDARCISGHPEAKPLPYYYAQKKVRCHNRQLHKAKILKGGVRKLNQAPKKVKGFELFDKVRYKGRDCFIFGRRTNGYFDLRLLGGTKIHDSANYKSLQLLEHSKTILTERRQQEDTGPQGSNSSPTYANA
jgi:N6-L-threonylcarbamoyladenine synthase